MRAHRTGRRKSAVGRQSPEGWGMLLLAAGVVSGRKGGGGGEGKDEKTEKRLAARQGGLLKHSGCKEKSVGQKCMRKEVMYDRKSGLESDVLFRFSTKAERKRGQYNTLKTHRCRRPVFSSDLK